MIRAMLVGLLFLGLAACNFKLPTLDKQADAYAQLLYQEISTGTDLSRDTGLDPSLRTPDALAALSGLRQQIPPGAPASVENRGFNFSVNNGLSTATLTHAYHYASGQTVEAQTVLRKMPGQADWSIVGFHINLGGAPPSGPAVTVTRQPGSPT